MMNSNRLAWIVTATGTALILLVQYLFRVVLGSRTPLETLPLLPGVLHLTYIHTNAAFSPLADSRTFLTLIRTGFILFVAAATFFISWLLSRSGKQMMKALQIGIGLLLAGTLCNIVEQVIFNENAVFIDVRAFEIPVFNLADTSIYLGAMISVISLILLAIKLVIRQWR